MKQKICLGLLVIAVLFYVQTPATLSAARVNSEPVLYTAATSYRALAWITGAERFPDGSAIYIKDAQGERKLFPDFAQTADANISFDGAKLIFTAKKQTSDHWQIWEAAFSDLVPKQITHGDSDSVRPFYLPARRIVYSTLQSGRWTLFNSSVEGTDEKQITFSAANVVATDVLRDGRILLESSYGGQDQPEIFAVYSDGSGFESIRCDHAGNRYAARELSSGDIVFTHGERLAVFSSPYAEEREVKLPAAQYAGDIAETTSHGWIISTTATPTGKFALRIWNPATRSLLPFASMSSQNLLQPVVQRSRAVPKIHPSALHDWKFVNLLALNVYTAKAPLAPGSVASVHVYGRDHGGGEMLLGTSPVESDGSFFVRVPGDTPVRFELTDSKGQTLQREKGWFWARAGEQRICVGCHAGPEHAPENAIPAVLEKSTEPVDLTRILSAQKGGL